MSQDQFRKVEDEFFRLKGQLAAGRITPAQFENALKELMFQDEQSRYWMIGADTGKWYAHDGKDWVEAKSPGATPVATPPAPANSRGSNNLLIAGAIGGLIVLCAIGVIGFLFASSQGIIKLSFGAPTATLVALPPSPSPNLPTLAPTSASTQTPTALPKPSATVTATLTLAETMAQADALILQSKFAEAIAVYEAVLKTDPSNALANARWSRALLFIAYLEYRSELYPLAVSKAEAAAQLAPNNGEVFTRLARAYDWNGNYDKALVAAQKAAQLTPNSPDANAVLAEAALDNNKTADAESAVQKALQLDPNNADAHRSLAFILYVSKQPTQAVIAELEKAAQLEPNLAVRQAELGWIYRVAKDYSKSLIAYQQAVALYPKAVYALIGLGLVAYDQNQFDLAADNLTRAIQINDQSADAHYILGQVYYAQNNCGKAIPEFQKTIDLNPKANLAMTYLGNCQLKAGNVAAAAELAQKAAAINPNVADTKALQSAIAAALATPTPALAPGFYVADIRSEPPQPKRNQSVGFYATFLNTTGNTQTYRWLVYIYRASNVRNSFGESAPQLSIIPVGTQDIKTISDWRTGVGACEDYFVRIAWLDNNNKATTFTMPDGKPAEKYFTVCP